MEITRYQDIRVLMYAPEGHGKRASDTGARFVIDGSVRKDRAGIKVAVHLVDTANNMQIMGDMHRSNLEAAQRQPSTIMGGVVLLLHHGMIPIAMIMFIASCVVPFLKIIGIILLLLSVQFN